MSKYIDDRIVQKIKMEVSLENKFDLVCFYATVIFFLTNH